MTLRGQCIALLWLFVAGCAPGDGPPLVATDITAYAPMPGTGMAVAYLELRNESDSPIVIARISSPEFARVELHESIVKNGISRMVRLDNPVIDAGSSLLMQPGGKHLMLMEPQGPVAAGSTLMLRITYDGDRLLELTTMLEDRMAP